MIGIHTVPAAIGFRIVLGALESGFFPGVYVIPYFQKTGHRLTRQDALDVVLVQGKS
jgi:hypothetical protein